jgi:hypothetical protein
VLLLALPEHIHSDHAILCEQDFFPNVINEDEDEEYWADAGAPSGGRRHPGYGDDNDNSEGEKDMQGHEKRTWKGMGTMDGKGKGKATEDMKGNGKEKGKGNGKGNGSVKQSLGGEDIS